MADQPQHVGMLPALESPKHFADLYASLSVYIRDWLSPRLPNHYAISVERGLCMLDEYGEPERFRPDVRIDGQAQKPWHRRRHLNPSHNDNPYPPTEQ